MAKTKKVRQPKAEADKSKKSKSVKSKVKPEPEEVTEEPTEELVETEEKVKKVRDRSPRAIVTLTGCSSLRRHGRVYQHGRGFNVSGEEQIEYFKKDPRFEVLEQK